MTKEVETLDINKFTDNLFKKNKDTIINAEEAAEQYKISSGSLKLDYILQGGFGAGFHRLGGVSEGGKTSEAFLVMANMFKEMPTTRGVYVKTERLSADLQKRTGIEFVSDPMKWRDGTCLMVESNVYEPVASFIEQLMFKDKTRKYCIIIDSLDGLNIKGDLEKDYGDATKVAGAPLISKIFMRRISIYVEKRGHMIFLISQKTAEIQASAYAPSDPKMVNGAGGNAVVHFSNTILQYEHRYKKDDILKDPTAKPDMFTNPIVGHYARVTVKKSTTEQSHIEVTYPIKHKRVGNSIWLERELLEFLQGFGYIEKGGAWFNFSSDLLEELKKAGITPSETKFQGENRTLAFLEEQPALVKALRNIALSQLTNL